MIEPEQPKCDTCVDGVKGFTMGLMNVNDVTNREMAAILEAAIAKLSMELFEYQQLLSRLNATIEAKPASHRIQEEIFSELSKHQRQTS